MKTILITGSNGLLGQKLTILLSRNPDFKIIATSKSQNKNTLVKNLTFHQLDISNQQAIRDLFLSYYPDVIINTAALTNVDECFSHQEECKNVNIQSVKNLVEESNNIYAHFVQLSTDFVFDGKKGKYSENDKPEPISIYGNSKADADQIVIENSVRWSIVRTSLVYGFSAQLPRKNIITWIFDSLSNNQNIRVNNDQFRTPTFAENLAIGIEELVKKEKTGIYNIAGKEYLSVLDIAKTTADFFNLDKTLISPVSSAELNEKDKRPLKAGLNIAKAVSELNYDPITIIEGIKIIFRQMGMK